MSKRGHLISNLQVGETAASGLVFGAHQQVYEASRLNSPSHLAKTEMGETLLQFPQDRWDTGRPTVLSKVPYGAFRPEDPHRYAECLTATGCFRPPQCWHLQRGAHAEHTVLVSTPVTPWKRGQSLTSSVPSLSCARAVRTSPAPFSIPASFCAAAEGEVRRSCNQTRNDSPDHGRAGDIAAATPASRKASKWLAQSYQ